MNVVILCAGFATRMYPLTRDFPKPLLEVGGKPVLDYLVGQILELPEIGNIHIVSNGKFFDHFMDWRQQKKQTGMFDRTAVFIHNDKSFDNASRLGAAADLFFALRAIKSPGRVLVAGGDNIFCFSLKPLWESFCCGDVHNIAALAETDSTKLRKTGVLELDEQERVIRLHEKPDQPQSTWICPPLYFFQSSVLNMLERFLQTPGNHDAPGYFIDYLSRHETVTAIKVHARRLDIGCLASYREADRLLRGQNHQVKS